MNLHKNQRFYGVFFSILFFKTLLFPSYQSQTIIPFKEEDQQTGPYEPSGPSCGTAGLFASRWGRGLGYAVLLLEQGVLCVLPILWAALLFSEAGWDFWICCVPAVSPRHRAGEGVERKGGGETLI